LGVEIYHFHMLSAMVFITYHFKDDNASQWKRGKFDPFSPKTFELTVTKICMDDYDGEPYYWSKFCHDAIIPFCPQIWENAQQVTRRAVFTALHWMQRCLVARNEFVCLSVCLSVCLLKAWIVTKRKKNLSRYFIPYERPFSLLFWEKEWLVGATPSTWYFGSNWPHRRFSAVIRSQLLSRNT